MRIFALLLAAVLTACFSPQYRDCTLACGQNGDCPDGLQCGEDGWCRVDRLAPACATLVNPDASTPSGSDGQACVCDPLQQTCCDERDACDLVGPTYAPQCRGADKNGVQGVTCQISTECASAHTCLDDPAPGLAGTCHRFCGNDGDCDGDGSVCALQVGPTAQSACSTHCDPRDADGCPAEHTCVLSWSGTRAWTDCRVAGHGERGDACSDHSDCERGLFCRGAPSGSCSEYCVWPPDEQRSSCSGDALCVALAFMEVRIGGRSYGYCLAHDD